VRKRKNPPKRKQGVNLCVNIDHAATLRQARRGFNPDPVEAAKIAESSGASGITVHLREDRRHINDRDVARLRKTVKSKLNLEMSINPGIVKIALAVVPDEATIVPEKRQQLTTEGGLNVIKNFNKLKPIIRKLKAKKIVVSLFIDPDTRQIKAAKEAGADFVEIHTGRYADAESAGARAAELAKIKKAVKTAVSEGLGVNAGHGLNYTNTRAVARIQGITDLNTGHSIISRAVLTGLGQAVKDMLKVME